MQISKLKDTSWQGIGRQERSDISTVLNKHRNFASYSDEIYNARIVNDGKTDILELTFYSAKWAYKSTSENFKIERRMFFDGSNWHTQSFPDKKLGKATITKSDWYCGRHYPIDSSAEDIVNKYTGKKHGITDIINIQQEKLDAQRDHRYELRINRVDERMKYVSDDVPPQLNDWIRDFVFLKSRYFIYKYKSGSKRQSGFCTYCRHTFEAKHIRTGSVTVCPKCGSELHCKSEGKVPNTIRAWAHISYVQPIMDFGSEPALCERIFSVTHTVCGFKKGAEQTETKISLYEEARRFLDADTFTKLTDSKRKSAEFYCQETDTYTRECRWFDRKSYNVFRMQIYPYNIDGIVKRSDSKVKNTEVSSIVPFVNMSFEWLMCRMMFRPWVEQIAKQGLYNLIEPLLRGDLYQYTDQTQRKPSKILSVDKVTLKHFADIDITADQYRLYKMLAGINPKMQWETFEKYLDMNIKRSFYSLKAVLENEDYRKTFKFNVEKVANYLTRQADITKIKGDKLIDLWRDYLSMAADLKMKFTSGVLFPKNVKKEHDEIMKIQTYIEYDSENARLAQRVKILEELSYSGNKYIIRPFKDAYDFINESAVLGHCVKTYIKRCADGETNIFGIRRADEPDQPYYTLTLSNDCVPGANLGKHNCEATPEVKAFVKRWTKKVLDKKRSEIAPLLKKKPSNKLKEAG